MHDVLDRLVDEFHERALPELLRRDQDMPQVRRKATVIVGMRRSGKTWFCYQHMRQLLHGGVDKEQLLYLNFEDDRLMPFLTSDFQAILDVYYSKFPALKTKRCHLFLDEVQRIPGWERFVRRVLDTENLTVYVTGSSSKLLSTEIATSLRGRSITVEIFPFGFSEYLRFHGDYPKSNARFGAQTRATLQNRLTTYLISGGFPEVQELNDELRRQVLRNHIDVVILRDIVERHRVSRLPALRALMRHAMTSPAARLSVNKFFNALKSQGVPATKNSLYDYMDYLEDSFLFNRAPIHSRSERVRRVNPPKVYVIDSGLLDAMSFQMTEDRGARLENLVYMHLRRQGTHGEYYFTHDGAEVDFVLPARRRADRRLIQVCWSLKDPDTKRRELDSLAAAMNELGTERATVVTWMDERREPNGIEIVPAWKWLLRNERV